MLANELVKIKSLKNQINITNKVNSNMIAGSNSIERDRSIERKVKIVKKNPNIPLTPLTCSGTSYKCDVAGSGKTEIKDVNTFPCEYDHLGTPIKDAGMSGRSFELPILHNWANSSNETKYTKKSLKDTIGFENFQ